MPRFACPAAPQLRTEAGLAQTLFRSGHLQVAPYRMKVWTNDKRDNIADPRGLRQPVLQLRENVKEAVAAFYFDRPEKLAAIRLTASATT